jgi:phosphoglycerate-specific signal transduction histidine kinase
MLINSKLCQRYEVGAALNAVHEQLLEASSALEGDMEAVILDQLDQIAELVLEMGELIGMPVVV